MTNGAGGGGERDLMADGADGGADRDREGVEGDRAGEGVAGSAPRRARRPRLVLWISLGMAAALAVLVTVLATSGQSGQESATSPLIGKPAPAIQGASILGGPAVQLSAFKGKWVLVNFAASWCIPCRQETPDLLSFAQDHHQSGDATIVTVAYDEGDVSDLAAFLRGSHSTWPAVNDGQAVVDYGVAGIPESYLVDPSGTVVAKYDGGVVASQLNAFIARASDGTE
jgi:cytochrome c biogenesis protein CcmG, thiol:disulfide interchange protein DsbE